MHPAQKHYVNIRSRKAKKSPALAKLFICLFLLLFLFAVAFFAFRQIKDSRWTGEGRLTLAIVQDQQIGLLSYDTGRDKAIWIPLPDNTQITALTYGIYPLESLWKLGEQEKIGGGKFLTQSLMWELGVGIDGYIAAPSSLIFWDNSATSGTITRAQKALSFLITPKTTNLSLWDILRFGWLVTGLRSDKIQSYNLETLNIGKRESLADEKEVFRINPELFQSRLSQNFLNSQIDSPLPVVITNHTAISGLAGKAALIVNSAGAQVVKVETGVPSSETGCQLLIPPSLQNHPLSQKLTIWFACRPHATEAAYLELVFSTL